MLRAMPSSTNYDGSPRRSAITTVYVSLFTRTNAKGSPRFPVARSTGEDEPYRVIGI
jgi:hypothetical protein